jgi:DNA-binding beta-propeller fold protein YncE
MKTIQAIWVFALLSISFPSALAQNSRLLVMQKGEESLAIFDPSSDLLIGQVPVGGKTGHEVVASPDGKLAFVPIYGNSGVGQPGSDGSSMTVIDLAALKVIGTVSFSHGVRPHQPVFGPKDGLLYVTTELDQGVTIVDPKTLKIVGTIPTGQPESHMLVISHDGRFGYTANVGTGTVSVLDMEARKTVKVIPISAKTQRISISNDDKWVFTADQTKPQIAVIEASTGLVKRWIGLEGLGYGTATTPDGRWLLVAIPDKHNVAVIDLKSMKVVRSVGVASDPQEVVVTPDGKSAWVSCSSANEVIGIDLTAWTLNNAIQTGRLPDGLAWAVVQ